MAGEFQITVEDTLKPLVAALDGLSSRRINGIIASTLTACAAEAQKDFRSSVESVFDRPKPFTINGTFVSRATSENLTAEVGFREYAGKGIAAGIYLQSEIHGGHRADKRYEVALQRAGFLPPGYQTTPGPSAKYDVYGNQSQGQIVQILSGLRAFSEVGFLANKTAASAKRKSRTSQGFFVVKPGDPTHLGIGIYQYNGEGTGRRILKVMNFIAPPTYSIRLPIEKIVADSLTKNFEPLFYHYANASIDRLRSSNVA